MARTGDASLSTRTATTNSVASSLSSTLTASLLNSKAISSSSSDNEAEQHEQLQQIQQHLQQGTASSLKQAEDLLLQFQKQQQQLIATSSSSSSSSSSNLYSKLLKHCSSSVSDLLQQRHKNLEEQAIEEKIQSEVLSLLLLSPSSLHSLPSFSLLSPIINIIIIIIILPRPRLQLEMVVGQRQKRRSRLDPSKIDLDCLDGSENVSVVERVSGKRITGSKAPPLKHLEEWLLRNPSYDVDPKWSHVVKATVSVCVCVFCE